ncbi:alkyl hydroperoxide reductase/ Thiol specific antioxidant/ Mal allergen [Paludibacter propionicigenes WB4]|uniref:Alkyl hydroperoxide reductase/ Thiol specific antioxidant/ Mal allergen n=1 Tax=Paludibacter propionicigenes (strain DSM 17365 / JCM 13257 / WB4) TaxID=694427 RepID=E4T7G9_PALPW|nr:TlpA disulfide reductase family protein [Paludibacter propionicigenes]ADQ80663.1 alkyl hydroperoxide reductase/ Thiol specific antioxidant/ Mal allergen [Paludibacter propionicigenes WB4]
MKKIYLALVLCGMVSITLNAVNNRKKTVSSNPVPNFLISGEVKGINQGVVYLGYRENAKDKKDSAIIAGGKFSFKGKVIEPVYAFLSTKDRKVFVGFFLENNKVTISVDSLGKSTVKGSPISDIYIGWAKMWSVVTQKAGDIYKRMNEEYKKEGLDPNSRTAKLSDSARKAFDDEFKVLNVETDSTVFPVVRKYPNSVASAFIIVDRYVSWHDVSNAQKMFNYLTPEARKSVYGIQIKEFLDTEAKVSIGKVAPNFTMNDTTGHPVKLSDFKGKYVLLDFWASWCGPCRKENPNVVNAYKKFHDKGFEIVQVSLDTKKPAWIAAIQKDGLNWNHLSDLKGWQNEAVLMYGVKAVPTNFLIDKDGKIIARDLREEKLQETLSEIFK